MPSQIQFNLIVVYFVYGLSFFTMGVSLMLESLRPQFFDSRRMIYPLAIFALLHGVHEWLEIFLLQTLWLGGSIPLTLSLLRIVLLAVSFFPLVLYGSMSLPRKPGAFPYAVVIEGGLLILFIAGIVAAGSGEPGNVLTRADVLARYLLAIPGATLSATALMRRSSELHHQERKKLALAFRLAAVGLALYGLSQLFAPPSDIPPATWLHSAAFLEVTHVPIQVVRAVLGILITYGLVRAIHLVEHDRQQAFIRAQADRVEALERVHEELIQRESLRRELIQRTVIAQEDERTRISRELHDESAQLLTAISLSLATLKGEIRQNSGALAIIEKLQELALMMSRQMHRMVRDLRPAHLDDLGLAPAIQFLVDEGRASSGVTTRFKVSGQRVPLNKLVETVIFRAVQEALNNIFRHAGVQEADISLEYRPECVRVTIVDQGSGFDVSEQKYGFGLAGMRERVEAVSGNLEIVTAPGAGTRIEIVVPLERASGDAEREEHGNERSNPNHAGG